MKERYEISVAGTEMVLLSEDNEEYVRRVAQLLHRRVTDMVLVKKSCTKIEALTLCALDYLDASLKMKAEVEALKTELDALKAKYHV